MVSTDLHTEGYGHYCNLHKARNRRHGHPQQTAITKAAIKSHLKTILLRRQKNPEATAWVKMEGQWAMLADQCRAALKGFRQSNAHHRPTRIACQEVVKVADAADGREVVDTVLAMFLMRDHQPHRFRTDAAFVYQVVRRVRALADMNCGVWFDPVTGKEKRAYRDVSPLVVEIMGKLIVEALGSAGVYLAKLEWQDVEKRQKESLELYRAMEELR